MDISIKPGKYVVAVSGGVDSMVLLDLLVQQYQSPVVSHQSSVGATGDWLPETGDYTFIVAHFEHGIREDSLADMRLVEAAAKRYKLPFVFAHGRLGAEAAEAVARAARYQFLEQTMTEEKAGGIITAHHQDDMLETAILNLLRGTGRLGLSSLKSRDKLLRPLLEYSKQDILDYAKAHKITWHEDSTNADDRYLRNYIRLNILPRFGSKGRAALLDRVRQAKTINDQIDELLTKDLDLQPAMDQLQRSWFVQLPYGVASEVMAAWLRRNGVAHFDRAMIDRLVVLSKTKPAGKVADIDVDHKLTFQKENITLSHR